MDPKFVKALLADFGAPFVEDADVVLARDDIINHLVFFIYFYFVFLIN